jgi:DNA repair exonuclease SbcCD ATPase subunit
VTTATEPTLAEQLDTQVSEYRAADIAIQAMKETTAGLVITDIANKKEVAAVVEAHQMVKKYRVQITKRGKELRAPATAFGKQVIAEENRLLGLITPIEKRLDDEREKLRAAEREKQRAAELLEEKRLQKRVGEMQAVNATINLDMLKNLNDEMFALELKAATEAESERVAEQHRRQVAQDVVDELRKWNDRATVEEVISMTLAATDERIMKAKLAYQKAAAEQREAEAERERLQKENDDQQKELERLRQAEAQRVAGEREPAKCPPYPEGATVTHPSPGVTITQYRPEPENAAPESLARFEIELRRLVASYGVTIHKGMGFTVDGGRHCLTFDDIEHWGPE